MQYWQMLMDRWKSQEGQAFVELTLLLPLLLMMLMGVVDFARVFHTALAITQAARAGAAYGAQSSAKSSDKPGMEQAARDAAAQDLDTSALTVTASQYCKCTTDGVTLTAMTLCTDTCAGSRQVYVQVITQKTFQTLWNYPGVPHTVNLSRTAILRAQ